jgi:hypothetical protein
MSRVERFTMAVLIVAIGYCLAISGDAIFGWPQL